MRFRKRQESQRTSGQEALPGRGLVGQFGVHECHYASLLVIVGGHLQAGQFTQGGIGTVGRNGQQRFKAGAVIQAQARAVALLFQRLDPRRAMQVHASRRQGRPQAIDQQVVLDDPAQLVAAQRIGVETCFTAARSIPDPHAPIGLCTRLTHRIPYTTTLQQIGVVRGEGVHAQIGSLWRPARGFTTFDQRDFQA